MQVEFVTGTVATSRQWDCKVRLKYDSSEIDAESKLSNRRHHYTHCHTVGGGTPYAPPFIFALDPWSPSGKMTPVASLSQCTHVLILSLLFVKDTPSSCLWASPACDCDATQPIIARVTSCQHKIYYAIVCSPTMAVRCQFWISRPGIPHVRRSIYNCSSSCSTALSLMTYIAHLSLLSSTCRCHSTPLAIH